MLQVSLMFKIHVLQSMENPLAHTCSLQVGDQGLLPRNSNTEAGSGLVPIVIRIVCSLLRKSSAGGKLVATKVGAGVMKLTQLSLLLTTMRTYASWNRPPDLNLEGLKSCVKENRAVCKGQLCFPGFDIYVGNPQPPRVNWAWTHSCHTGQCLLHSFSILSLFLKLPDTTSTLLHTALTVYLVV